MLELYPIKVKVDTEEGEKELWSISHSSDTFFKVSEVAEAIGLVEKTYRLTLTLNGCVNVMGHLFFKDLEVCKKAIKALYSKRDLALKEAEEEIKQKALLPEKEVSEVGNIMIKHFFNNDVADEIVIQSEFTESDILNTEDPDTIHLMTRYLAEHTGVDISKWHSIINMKVRLIKDGFEIIVVGQV